MCSEIIRELLRKGKVLLDGTTAHLLTKIVEKELLWGSISLFVIPEFREDPSDKHEELNLNCTRMSTHHRIVPLRVVLAMRPLQRRWRNLLQRWWLGLKSMLSLSNFSSEAMFDSTQGAKAKEGVEEVQESC